MYYTFEQFKEAFIDELKQANAVDGDGPRLSEDDKPYLKLLDRSQNRLVMFTKSPIQLIANERQRQIEVEGWKPEHDDKHLDESLAIAASCYALPEFYDRAEYVDTVWPWEDKWWKPSPEDRVRELVKAGALIVAEIERLHRAQ